MRITNDPKIQNRARSSAEGISRQDKTPVSYHFGAEVPGKPHPPQKCRMAITSTSTGVEVSTVKG